MVLYGMTPEAQRERAPSVVVSLVSRVVTATGCAANSAASIAYLLVNHYFSLMTLGQLRSLLEVASAGSVRGAAERLFVTQPAVSSQIAALQKELGVRLVARDGRGLRVTPAGAVLAGYARRVLGLLEEAAVATQGAAAPERGRVRLAAVTTAGEQLLPRLIAGFRGRHPSAEISLEVANRPRVFSLLEHHEADLVIGGRPPDPSPLRSLAERPNSLVLVAPPGMLPRSPRPEDLARRTWLLREPGS